MSEPAAAVEAILARLDGTPLVLLLDIDGTLAPIVSRPELAEVPPETRRALASLAASPAVHVGVVSGRGAGDARRLAGLTHGWVIGNHGLETIAPDGEETVDRQVAPFRPGLAKAARALERLLAAVPGVTVEDKIWSHSVHYRLADPAVVPRVRRAVEDVAREHGLRVTTGKLIFELRAPVKVDKGTAVVALADRLGGLEPSASLVFAGDDVSDEDAFRLLRVRVPHAITVRIGAEPPETAAEFRLPDPAAMRVLLERLAEARRATARR
ncbi:MAG TPA: trehalose-phosphatase [Gemmatimonadaceae bacterium]|nr:trehalose-phosphatase [Gemmatimonadaceae bacterium]